MLCRIMSNDKYDIIKYVKMRKIEEVSIYEKDIKNYVSYIVYYI